MAVRVLISYSHDSDEHAQRVLDLSDRLREDGVDCRIDRYLEKGPPQGWALWMNDELEAADVVLIVFTERYAQKAREPKRSGVKFESVIVLQELYEAGMLNEKFIPIVFDAADEQHIVKWLRPYHSYDVGGEAGYEKLRRRLVDDPEVIMPPVGTVRKKGPRRHASRAKAEVKLAHLPAAGPLLVGRDVETARLDTAWETPSQHVISVVARGGEGKTNLVRHWLHRMSAEGWRGAERVFGWSFFSQGSKDKAASADQFIDEALRFFGENSPESIKTPHERGERLAQLAGSARNLLILDGLEPLQYPPGPMEGRLKDPALQTLLSGLSAYNTGLCIITTREPLPELASGRDTVSPEIELPALTDEAGAELLQRLKVGGSDEQRAAVSHRLGGHALSLQLLGTYLHEVHDGDVTRAGEVALLDQDPASGEHARHILESYERWLSGRNLAEDDPGRAEVERSGAPMLAVLRLLGLFDRPAEMKLIDALRADPPIPGLTESLVGLPHAEWKRTLSRLRKLKLIDDDKTAIDAHPLIREYFAAQLAQRFPDGAREAHRRLFEELKKSAPHRPDTLQEMMPLYAAVRHGCKAGLWQEALDEVYLDRIYRGGEGYSWRKLGAFGADLEALTAFTVGESYMPMTHLAERDRSWILGVVGFALTALGRYHETQRVLEMGFQMDVQLEDWANAGISARNLCDFHLIRAEVAPALRWAVRSMELTDREPTRSSRTVFSKASAGDALHAAGAFAAARSAFQAGLELRATLQPVAPTLESLSGFLFRDFLLNEASTPLPHVRQDAEAALKSAERLGDSRFNFGLSHLVLVKLYLREAAQSMGAAASLHADKAVSLLRAAGVQSYLAAGLIGRAAVWRTWPELHDDWIIHAERDLTEVEQIANSSDYDRWRIEAALERSRLYLALNEKEKALEKLEEAKRLIKKTDAPYVPPEPLSPEWEPPEYARVFKAGDIVGYHRADADVAALERALA